mmetsp:Transcript_2598/g.9494  ORF Transcript_2598/g.9494 Transcript_2598/m.9494 type:complete len:217 (+) Transcript_2598:295-945(+)
MAGGEHFDDSAADAPDVGSTAVAEAFEHFGRHPKERPFHRFEPTRERRLAKEGFRGAKVREFDDGVVRQQNVGPFEVAVDDFALVQVLEAEEELARVVGDHLFVEASKPLQHLRERAPRHKLQKDVHLGRANLLRRNVADDVAVAEALAQLNLALERRHRRLLSVARVLNLELFHRHELARALVEAGEHLSVRPLAEQLAAAPLHLARLHLDTLAE